MPGLLRRLLGFIVLAGTIGLATCQSMVKAEPCSSGAFTEAHAVSRLKAE